MTADPGTLAGGMAACDGRALGTTLRVVVTDAAALAQARAAVDRVVAAIDLACSRFRTDSELVRVQEAGRPVRVSPLLTRAIEVALSAARQTDGLVDPTVGTAVVRLGYAGDFDSVARDGGPVTLVASRVPGWQALTLDPGARTLSIPAGVIVDLGATAKALASDLAAAEAAAATGAGVLVSLGGDIAVAGRAPEGGWAVGVADVSEAAPGAVRTTVALTAGGLATSSTSVRRWRRGDVEIHHIVDPRTSLPAVTPWRTVSVAAGDCVGANTAATAAMILGSEAPAWLEARRLPALLVRTDGEMVRAGGWPG